jgi:hypothetical protein
MSDSRKQFAKLAQSKMVRGAVQAMPQHMPPTTDARFSELLNRLSVAERKSD